MKVLFVCRGNMGRSQIAEVLFKKYHPEHKVISAGTVAKSKGKNLPSDIIKMMKQEGIDISNNKCKKLTKKIADSSDVIINLSTKDEFQPKFLNNSKKLKFWPIKDPEKDGIRALRNTKNILKKE